MTGFDSDGWRADMAHAVNHLLLHFQARFGYPPDEQTIGGPAAADELARASGVLPEQLLTFYRHVSEVDLPDVFNGFFIHPLNTVLANLPDPLTPKHAPGLTDSSLVVFGSDGGGTLFALGTEDGVVYVLPVGEIRDGAYLGGGAEPGRAVFQDLWDFLGWLLHAVRGVAEGDLEKAVYPG
ncbi:hypothetical protein AB0A74_05210 [Saccharothrix sp. NPDC042600]|uniref:hypothetical protein n=1 Tax=Saccharothrix TaxID=2071 RepID=UPI0033E3AD4C|nr:hypothetical protein GCM10017745_36960 [Saccharothrix mutabilis subsp. capreolus]